MKIISVNVGTPQMINWQGKLISTAIFKYPAEERILVSFENLAGDKQADLTVHGGVSKAVYLYPYEHYAYWQSQLPDYELSLGNFGENFTTAGLLEEEVKLGDIFRFGTAELMAVQPRFPCFKLGIRFENALMVKKFWQAQRNGIYFRVLREGLVGKNDPIELLESSSESLTILDIIKAFTTEKDNIELLSDLAQSTYLAEGLKFNLKEILKNKTNEY